MTGVFASQAGYGGCERKMHPGVRLDVALETVGGKRVNAIIHNKNRGLTTVS